MSKNKSDRMYPHRRENIGIVEGCIFDCIYCQFRKLQQRFGKTEEDIGYAPHLHPERLKKKPKSTKGDEFVTIGLNGDIACTSSEVMHQIIQYCTDWKDRTFVLQTKCPERFKYFTFPDNVILGITLETNRDIIWGGDIKDPYIPADATTTRYDQISKAPLPTDRINIMCQISHPRKMVTIEPILDFDDLEMMVAINRIFPERIYIGYDSGDYHLPEPPLEKTRELIKALKGRSNTVFEKQLRPAWYEKTE